MNKLLAPVTRKIQSMIGRAVVTYVSEDLQRQNLQLKMQTGESADNIERFQNYGMSSYPPLGSEAIVAALNGNLAKLVAIAVEAKQYRPQGDLGDVFLYHLEGHNIRLTKDGKLLITATDVIYNATNSFTIISPNTTVQGPLHVTENITTDADMIASNISYLGHKHQETDSVTKPPQKG